MASSKRTKEMIEVRLIEPGSKSKSNSKGAALASSYDAQIRPLLDAVDRLRNLKVMQEGIQLPTIVVVGDQSSGKSSVLESLAGISLPRGQGICTRVPLIMRLKRDKSAVNPEMHLEYQDRIIQTTESGITAAISKATDEIAGSGKAISNTPLTLVVKKTDVPDLTMVDLPGITRVPVQGQPENIYEQISGIIKEYISPKESIILNVLSAAADFSICESIQMSRQVDRNGERTLAVVTKVDMAPVGLHEKVMADDVKIGLGYVCVRNRVGDETYDEARVEEANLFKNHSLLSKIDKSIVGVPVLAQRLMQIQAASISKCLPDIVKKINDKLSFNVHELDHMPSNLSNVADAMRAFMKVLSSMKETLKKILIQREYDEYPDDFNMHGVARIVEMLTKYSQELPVNQVMITEGEFLMEEIKILEEAKAIGLPNFLPESAFKILLKRKIDGISHLPIEFVKKVWNYIEEVVIRVLVRHSDNYPQLQSSMTRAAQNLIERMSKQSCQVVQGMIDMERVGAYTSNPDYMMTWCSLMEKQDHFMDLLHDHSKPSDLDLGKFGKVKVDHLRQQQKEMAEKAFDLRMRMIAYWRSVILRLVDGPALHILYNIQKLVETEMDSEIVDEIAGHSGTGLEKMLEESPTVARKRDRLRKSIELLKESKQVVARIMDRIALLDD
ncbi:Dynamin GTPase protein [Dioscorea alata]|uniref:Dynamin GTPase protein n=1 Tax=Dioscorea alata TaxID=55571 RepID=A0ACB7W7L4_DIOAL|nr:Dynamin GTPase protein [Dioscorea alata]